MRQVLSGEAAAMGDHLPIEQSPTHPVRDDRNNLLLGQTMQRSSIVAPGTGRPSLTRTQHFVLGYFIRSRRDRWEASPCAASGPVRIDPSCGYQMVESRA